MSMSSHRAPSNRAHQRLTPRLLGVGVAFSLAGTAVVGGVLFLALQNVWWLAAGSMLSLFGAGVYLGWRSREPEPLYGALLAVVYFGLVAALLFGSALADAFPDPLPGLAIGDSTFFFVWPLLMLAASVTGCIVGGRSSRSTPSLGEEGKARV